MNIAIGAALDQRNKQDNALAMVKVYTKENSKCIQ
jgi:hypothetical protein